MRKFVASLIGVALAVWTARGWHQNASHEAAFETLAPLETEASVIQRMGKADVVESAGNPMTGYATDPCRQPCERRLWWENTFLPGIEAWSVEIGKDGRVLRTSHWVSP